MTRLFLRFYIGVVLILIAASMIQGYVSLHSSGTKNIGVVEDALAGGARLARDRLMNLSPIRAAIAFQELQREFEYPIQPFTLDAEWLPPESRQRLLNGEVVLLGEYLCIALVDPPVSDPSLADERVEPSDLDSRESDPPPSINEIYGLIFGPLPQFVGPSQSAITLGYAVVFFLTAIAIAVLLRPVASQFRAVERTATAIADGDLSARIDRGGKSNDLALVHAFNKMADRTQALLRSQRELLQAVSHELRTPLARIRFAADLVDSASSDEERRSRLDAIDAATEKLDQLVRELLTYVRLESNALDVKTELVDVQSLINLAIETYASLNSSIHFTNPIGSVELQIQAHRESIARAIENLVSNAGRHAKSTVQVTAHIEASDIVIHVDDDGDGIPEADRQKVLEPFVRLNNTEQLGSGLGLALVSRIVEQHQGGLTVSDSPLGGARLTLKLPIHGAAAMNPSNAQHTP